jgi:hypothetical protein
MSVLCLAHLAANVGGVQPHWSLKQVVLESVAVYILQQKEKKN